MSLGGFVILFQDTPQHQWFYHEWKPWVHYVPVKHDLSDLFERIEWLRANDDKAHEISVNAIKFAQFHFHKDTMRKYTKELIKEYHDVYNADLIERDGKLDKDPEY